MLVFNELYSAKLITFCCLSIVIASYKTTGVISFSQLRSNTETSKLKKKKKQACDQKEMNEYGVCFYHYEFI